MRHISILLLIGALISCDNDETRSLRNSNGQGAQNVSDDQLTLDLTLTERIQNSLLTRISGVAAYDQDTPEEYVIVTNAVLRLTNPQTLAEDAPLELGDILLECSMTPCEYQAGSTVNVPLDSMFKFYRNNIESQLSLQDKRERPTTGSTCRRCRPCPFRCPPPPVQNGNSCSHNGQCDNQSSCFVPPGTCQKQCQGETTYCGLNNHNAVCCSADQECKGTINQRSCESKCPPGSSPTASGTCQCNEGLVYRAPPINACVPCPEGQKPGPDHSCVDKCVKPDPSCEVDNGGCGPKEFFSCTIVEENGCPQKKCGGGYPDHPEDPCDSTDPSINPDMKCSSYCAGQAKGTKNLPCTGEVRGHCECTDPDYAQCLVNKGTPCGSSYNPNGTVKIKECCKSGQICEDEMCVLPEETTTTFAPTTTTTTMQTTTMTMAPTTTTSMQTSTMTMAPTTSTTVIIVPPTTAPE
jgi:hypothetical protein